MCCSITYKDGPRTIVIHGFDNVYSAVHHANSNGIENYNLEVNSNENA